MHLLIPNCNCHLLSAAAHFSTGINKASQIWFPHRSPFLSSTLRCLTWTPSPPPHASGFCSSRCGTPPAVTWRRPSSCTSEAVWTCTPAPRGVPPPRPSLTCWSGCRTPSCTTNGSILCVYRPFPRWIPLVCCLVCCRYSSVTLDSLCNPLTIYDGTKRRLLWFGEIFN